MRNRTRVPVAVGLVAACITGFVGISVAVPTTTDPSGQLTVLVGHPDFGASIGQRFEFDSTVRNDSEHPDEGLVAHLDVLSVDPAVYVDPEDWSAQRTAYLPPLPAHHTTRVPWSVQAVNEGDFVVFVTVTRRTGTPDVDTGQGFRMSVAPTRRLDTGGSLPVVLGVPTGIAALLVLAALRRRRLSRTPRPSP